MNQDQAWTVRPPLTEQNLKRAIPSSSTSSFGALFKSREANVPTIMIQSEMRSSHSTGMLPHATSQFSKNTVSEIKKSNESLNQLTLSSQASRGSESRIPTKVRSMSNQLRSSKSPALSGRSSAGSRPSFNKPRFRYDSIIKRSSEIAEEGRLTFRSGALGEAVDKAITYFKDTQKQTESALDRSMSAMSMLSVTSAMPEKAEKLKAALDSYKRRLKIQKQTQHLLEDKLADAKLQIDQQREKIEKQSEIVKRFKAQIGQLKDYNRRIEYQLTQEIMNKEKHAIAFKRILSRIVEGKMSQEELHTFVGGSNLRESLKTFDGMTSALKSTNKGFLEPLPPDKGTPEFSSIQEMIHHRQQELFDLKVKFDILPTKRKKVNEKNRSLMKTQSVARPKTPGSIHSAKKMYSPHSESSLHRARPPSAQVTTGMRKMIMESDEPKIKVIKRASTKESQGGGGMERSAGFFNSGPKVFSTPNFALA